MSGEWELEKFVKGAFFDGFPVGYDTRKEEGALDPEGEAKELKRLGRYGAERYWRTRFVPMFREYRRLMGQCLKEAKNKKGGTRQFRQNQSR